MVRPPAQRNATQSPGTIKSVAANRALKPASGDRLALSVPTTPIALLILAVSAIAHAQQPATSGTFVLHKFAKAIGQETYVIEPIGDTYTLTSHFLFTDRRAHPIPLETTFTAATNNMAPKAYAAKGKSSRLSDMDNTIAANGNALTITRTGKTDTQTPTGPWFIADGYSPRRIQSISYKVAVTVSIVLVQATRGGGDTGTEMWKFCAATVDACGH